MSNILERAVDVAECHVWVVPDNDGSEERLRAAAHAPNIEVKVFSGHGVSPARRLLREVTGRQPAFFVRGPTEGEAAALKAEPLFDWVWVSRFALLGFLTALREKGVAVAQRTAVGLNDVTTTLYLDSLREVLSGRYGMDLTRALQGVRTPFVWISERRLLRNVDLVHVQTHAEARRFGQVVGSEVGSSVIVRPNGIEPSLIGSGRPPIPDGDHVLFMTHLRGARARESKWFLERVWPKVREAVPSARLLLGGTPPRDHEAWSQSESVEVLGWVPRLADAYTNAVVAVVPVLHRTGLVNRVVDAMAAGVPVVATPEAFATAEGAIPGTHGVVARSVSEFADAVVGILRDKCLRARLAAAGQEYARSRPTDEESADLLLSALRQRMAMPAGDG